MKQSPNVIYILADDMGYGDFGIFSDGSSRTPNLDRLVSQGCTLSNCCSASPVCAPARASLLTGRYPQRTGAVDTYEGIGSDRLCLKETTLADIFQQNGYRTGLIGKWHLGLIGDEYHPCRRGFDTFVGFRGGWSDYYHYTLYRGQKKELSAGEYMTHLITRESLLFLEENRNRPFFLHIAYNAPHFPFQCPEEYVRPFLETGRFNPTLATLYGMIACMDEGIGQIMDYLDQSGLSENTILVFASDNGPQLYGDTDRYNCFLHGQKGDSYEGGIRVPAVIRWPGHLPANSRSHSFFHGCDWFPTLLEACEIPAPEGLSLDGKSRLKELEIQTPFPDNASFWQYNRFTPVSRCNAAIRRGRWKLVWPAIDEALQVPPEIIEMDEAIKKAPSLPDHPYPFDDSSRVLPPPHKPQLFNLEDDPLERHDLAEKYPLIVKKLSQEFDGWFADVMEDYEKAAADNKKH